MQAMIDSLFMHSRYRSGVTTVTTVLHYFLRHFKYFLSGLLRPLDIMMFFDTFSFHVLIMIIYLFNNYLLMFRVSLLREVSAVEIPFKDYC